MAITTRDGLIAAMAAGTGSQFFKSQISTVNGFSYCLFRVPGQPGAAAIPSTASGNTCDRTTVGAILLPAPFATTYLTTFQASNSVTGSLRLADRLVETGTLSFITTTAQTINSVALPARATGALDVELWLEVYTAGGATASAVVTCSYTNQAGVAGRTAELVGGFPASSGTQSARSYQLSLQAGDSGVQSVQSCTSTTSTGVAGAFGVVLRRRIATGIVNFGGFGFNQGYAETGLEKIPDSACLELIWLSTGGNTGTVQGAIDVAQG